MPDGMSACEADQFQQLIKRSTDVFALNDDELGCTNMVSHRIDTGEHPPVNRPPYRSPMVYRDQIAQMVTNMQERGIVQPSTSRYNDRTLIFLPISSTWKSRNSLLANKSHEESS